MREQQGTAGNPLPRWTDAEKDYLRKHWPHKTRYELAEDLGRAPHGVQDKARRMGLKKRKFKAGKQAHTKADTPAARITIVQHAAGRIITHRMVG